MSKKPKNVCKTLRYIEQLLIFSCVAGCVWLSAFDSLISISTGIASLALGLKICSITAGIKSFKSIIKKKQKKVIFLAKDKLNTIKVLLFKDLIGSYTNH